MTKIRSRSDVLTKSFLEECFEVNFETGTLTWKRRPRHHFPTERGWKIANTQRAGKKANTGVPRVSLTNDKAIPNRDGRKFVARNEHGVSKTYTVSKYGYDEAFRLACEWVNNSPSGLKGRT